MTSKLPWATAAVIIIVVAGIGAWTIWGPVTEVPVTEVPVTGYATIRALAGPGTVFAGPVPACSGIENIYIVKNTHAAGWDINFGDSANQENVLGIITTNGGSVDIPYETAFRILVAVKGCAPDNMAYVVKENIQVELKATGSFEISLENAPDLREYVFENSNYGTTNGYLRLNAAWENAGNGYKLPASGSITLDPVNLWTWKATA